MAGRCRSGEAARPALTAGARRLLELKASAFQALGHSARLSILEALRHGERCVCEIGPVLGLRQPNVSQHLSILKAAGLVASRRDGTRVIYRVVDPAILDIIDLMGQVVRRQGEELAEAVTRSAWGT